MPEGLDGTGACGVNCLACGLMRTGKCGPCGPGGSRQAHKKLAAQLGLLGAPCPILHCATQRGVAHCGTDCDQFPCPRFAQGPYPFSQAWLDMQVRRRANAPAPPPARPGRGGMH